MSNNDAPNQSTDWRLRRDDLAWLLLDLRSRRDQMRAFKPQTSGFMREANDASEGRFERLILLVQEINA